jgi:hypothetical protein
MSPPAPHIAAAATFVLDLRRTRMYMLPNPQLIVTEPSRGMNMSLYENRCSLNVVSRSSRSSANLIRHRRA